MERHSTSTLVVYSRKKEMSFVFALTLLERGLAVDICPSVRVSVPQTRELWQVNLLANCAKQIEKQWNNIIMTMKHSDELPEKQIRSSKLMTDNLREK